MKSERLRHAQELYRAGIIDMGEYLQWLGLPALTNEAGSFLVIPPSPPCPSPKPRGPYR